ncbi:hypothetical protein ALQ37_03750 [Pseudomonas syringae pv. aptata]|uniref:Uncharacterized protein n=1 Tax=Pseudomonas syringae pv. aptata TaxID=83167 RepID=A0A3M3WLJ8_PSEAP|nr:hypothetical protein ALQ37_03750 [Pseudomonas syringae pv. aptata]
MLIEHVPLFLPALHGRFGVFQSDGRLLGGGAGHFLLGLKHLQLFAEGGEQGGVVPKVRFSFLAGTLSFSQVILQLAQPLLTVLNALFDAGNVAADRIKAALHQVEAFGQVMVAVTQPFDTGIGTALIGHQRLEAHFLIADHRLALPHQIIQRLPAQGRQLRFQLALFSLVFLILLGSLSLSVQTLQLTLELFTQVGQARQVLVGATNAVFGFPAPLLVLGDPRGFFDEVAQVFRLGLD